MEVHSHTHSPRKKWTHYFWEFFMLFLAVTLGFFVENQREHLIEHRRETQYMRSMIEDLKSDTAQLTRTLAGTDSSRNNIDSMLLLLTGSNIPDKSVVKAYDYTFPALNTIPVVFNERTITQLRNSGSMRMIRNPKVNDGLVAYWNHIEIIKKALDRHAAYRTKGRDMETGIFNTAEIFLKTHGIVRDSFDRVRLVNHEPLIIREYANTIAYCGIMINSLQKQFREQQKLATALIVLIKKEYHL